MNKLLTSHLSIGPGGRSCPCCFPPPGSKARKAKYHRAKLREKNSAIKIEENEMRV